mmetsp:Transcript_3483/g.8855  ORF Transcript_3483/g.8855 Transcript_3483/m.8855 type:complete len:312 (-) Transcript_3483:2139-3074(-)
MRRGCQTRSRRRVSQPRHDGPLRTAARRRRRRRVVLLRRRGGSVRTVRQPQRAQNGGRRGEAPHHVRILPEARRLQGRRVRDPVLLPGGGVERECQQARRVHEPRRHPADLPFVPAALSRALRALPRGVPEGDEAHRVHRGGGCHAPARGPEVPRRGDGDRAGAGSEGGPREPEALSHAAALRGPEGPVVVRRRGQEPGAPPPRVVRHLRPRHGGPLRDGHVHLRDGRPRHLRRAEPADEARRHLRQERTVLRPDVQIVRPLRLRLHDGLSHPVRSGLGHGIQPDRLPPSADRRRPHGEAWRALLRVHAPG